MEPTELQRLLINEVSGVDDPANEIPGWLVAKAAASDAEAAAATEDTPTFVARLKASFGRPAGKDDIDMTADELTATLKANNDALVESLGASIGAAVADAVTKAAPAPEAAAAAPAADAPAVTMEAIEAAILAGVEAGLTKAIDGDDTTKGVNDVLGAMIDRVEKIEKAFGVAARTSLDGQESAAGDAPATDTTKSKAPAVSGVQSAIAKALKNPGKPVFLAGHASDGAAL